MKETKTVKKSPLFSFKYFAYDFVKYTGGLPGLLFFRTKNIYESEAAKKKIKGGAILIANHIGFMDPVHIMFSIWYRRHHFVCMDEVYRFPLTWFLCIPINRENTSLASFKGIINHLKAGDLVCMFPEGAINITEEAIAGFKSGMVLMALRSGCPIIPIYVKKRENIFERLKVAIGEPVDVSSIYGKTPTLAQIDMIAESLHKKENKLRILCESK